jgi:hypothetical protein
VILPVSVVETVVTEEIRQVIRVMKVSLVTVHSDEWNAMF